MWNRKLFKSKIISITLHVGVWAALFIIPTFVRPTNPPFVNGPPGLGDNFPTDNSPYSWFFLLPAILVGSFFYLNAYFLLPVLLFRKKPFLYFAAIFVTISALTLIHHAIRQFLQGDSFHTPPPLFILFPLIVAFAVSTAFRLLVDKIKEDRFLKEKETENLKTELLFLRSQISPHFIFNILNNLVSLARKKSDQLEPVLIKLSSLIRYMLYESIETVSLETEIDYLNNYVELQKLRFGDKVEVVFDVIPPIENYSIEPMILIPFVENAFKHGVGMINKPRIEVNIQVVNHELQFRVSNRFNPAVHEVKDKNSGIGLANLTRRMTLLYGTKHTLTQEIKDDWYISSLTLVLK